MSASVECRTCERCRAVTPHSRPMAGLEIAGALAMLAIAGWFFWLGKAGVLLGGACALVALGFVAADRRSLRRIACERCRGKEWARRASVRLRWWRGMRNTAHAC